MSRRRLAAWSVALPLMVAGSQGAHVFAYRLIAKGTVEEKGVAQQYMGNNIFCTSLAGEEPGPDAEHQRVDQARGREDAAERELVPFAKAYSGLTDEEIREVDGFIRRNTLERFGPVRVVKPELVFETIDDIAARRSAPPVPVGHGSCPLV